jgi:hypothetical protein
MMTQGEEHEHFKQKRQERLFRRNAEGQCEPWLVFLDYKGLNHVYDSWNPDMPLPRIGERVLTVDGTWLDHVVCDIVHTMHPTNPAIWVYVRPRTWWERMKENFKRK